MLKYLLIVVYLLYILHLLYLLYLLNSSKETHPEGYEDEEGDEGEKEGGKRYIWMPKKWSKCSRECDTGVQKRRVLCIDTETNEIVDASLCDEDTRPEQRQKCNRISCDRIESGKKLNTYDVDSSVSSSLTAQGGIAVAGARSF